MRIVVALGGNALARRGEALDMTTQQANVARAAEALAHLARCHALVVTHGNGPQVGLLALQAQAYADVPPYPLDVLDAESAGLIGYLIDRALATVLPGRHVATLLTQVEVDPDDPAFRHPTKPIGPSYDLDQAQRLARERGWSIAEDNGRWRRVVASPEPLRILELDAIRLLVDAGTLVICTGGGGIPVTIDPDGAVRGAEAVIDKDLAASLLAQRLGADALLLLTDVDAVYRDWNTPQAQPIREATPHELLALRFAPGSMQPKVDAACRFVQAGGGYAAIGRLEDATAIVAGTRGTLVRPGGDGAARRSRKMA